MVVIMKFPPRPQVWMSSPWTRPPGPTQRRRPRHIPTRMCLMVYPAGRLPTTPYPRRGRTPMEIHPPKSMILMMMIMKVITDFLVKMGI